MRARTSLIVHVRNLLKGFGIQLPKCATTCFHKRVLEHLPETLKPAIEPLLESLKTISRQIYEMEKAIEKLSKDRYPEMMLLQQVVGVGPLCSLTFILTIDDPTQFKKSRDIGAYLGLVPRQHQSGERDPALGISKRGDTLLRTLLVQAVHHQLARHGPDCDLKRFGQKLVEKGGPRSKNCAVIAVARKLAVLLHRLWSTGEVYDPFYNTKQQTAQATA